MGRQRKHTKRRERSGLVPCLGKTKLNGSQKWPAAAARLKMIGQTRRNFEQKSNSRRLNLPAPAIMRYDRRRGEEANHLHVLLAVGSVVL